MAETVTLVEVEALLRNGREVLLQLELPRDSMVMDETLICRVEVQPGVVEEHSIPQSELAYLRVRRTEVGADPTGMRTLGRGRRAPEMAPQGV